MDGLILFSHGSLLCGAGQALKEHAQRLRDRGEWAGVEIGYLNYSSPPFSQAVDSLADRGIRRIIVVPYFLVPGKFVSVDLPATVDRERARHPAGQLIIAEPIGSDESLADAILKLAAQARGPESWSEGLAHASARCEQNPQCPLFGTARCPTTAGSASEALT